MLKLLHHHIFARKLQSVFVSCPLVLPVQTLGSVDQIGLRNGLQEAVNKQLGSSDVTVEVCRISNSSAAATGNSILESMFRTSNLLVGFSTPQQREATQAAGSLRHPTANQLVKRSDSFSVIVGGLLKQQQPGPHLAHPVLRHLVEAAMQLPTQHSVVLLGAFYKHRHFTMQQMQQWVKLDQHQVYGEVLQALEGPMEGVLQLDSALEELLGSLDGAGAEPLLHCLDFQAAAAPQPDTAAAAAS